MPKLKRSWRAVAEEILRAPGGGQVPRELAWRYACARIASLEAKLAKGCDRCTRGVTERGHGVGTRKAARPRRKPGRVEGL